jgi:asparagine synthase (glutamine-hydrolysing)
VVSLDAVSLLTPFAAAFDEPFGDPSAIPTLRLAQVASQELKVVLTGDGGDELFGGYERYGVARSRERIGPAWGLVRAASRPAASAFRHLSPGSRVASRLARVAELARLDGIGRYDRMMRVMDPTAIGRLLGGSRPPSIGPVEQVLRADAQLTGVDRYLRADLLTYLPEDLLVKVDRATMASSLEARSPLLDQELIAFASRLPIDRKLHRGRAKIVLREAARTILPPHLIDHPKHGFTMPINEWFLGALGLRFQELALAPDAFLRGVVDVGEVSRLHGEHMAGRRSHGRHLWQLLALELWGRTWANGPTIQARAAASPPVLSA